MAVAEGSFCRRRCRVLGQGFADLWGRGTSTGRRFHCASRRQRQPDAAPGGSGLPHEPLAMVSRASVAGFTGHWPNGGCQPVRTNRLLPHRVPARVATHPCRAGQVPAIDPLGELQAVPTGTATCGGPAEATGAAGRFRCTSAGLPDPTSSGPTHLD